MAADYETVTVYVTSDGKHHRRESDAQEWAEWLNDLEAANEMFRNGATLLAAINRACQSTPWKRLYDGAEQITILGKITKDTEFVIGHWQCRDTPGYKVCDLLPDDTLYVYGDAGSRSGPYGGRVPVSNLIRYYKGTFA